MRAVGYSTFGAAQTVLKPIEIDTPTPQEGEVLVRLAYSGANPSDAKARAGARPGVTKPAFDLIIPNSDGSGEIIAVGAGVDPSRIGEKVWIWNGQWQRPLGTAAEFIALPSAQAVTLADGMSLETGACIGIPGLTAAQVVLGQGTVKDQTLLISGGAGSVGHLAIQLAKWSGAKVIATGRPNGFDRMHRAGADVVLDYQDPDLASQILSHAPNGVDRAIEVEFGENIDLLHQVVRPLGTIATYGSAKNMAPQVNFGPLLFKALKIDISLIYILPMADRLARIQEINTAHADGMFKPDIDQIFDLADTWKAHDATLSAGRKGAILIQV